MKEETKGKAAQIIQLRGPSGSPLATPAQMREHRRFMAGVQKMLDDSNPEKSSPAEAFVEDLQRTAPFSAKVFTLDDLKARRAATDKQGGTKGREGKEHEKTCID